MVRQVWKRWGRIREIWKGRNGVKGGIRGGGLKGGSEGGKQMWWSRGRTWVGTVGGGGGGGKGRGRK